MVAVIKSSQSLRNALQYNEHKLMQGAAELIHSANFVKETADLGFTDKLATLQHMAQLNQRTKINSVHISLNFDPSENLSKPVLQQIAVAYMDKIGFGNQPYLVYQHHDAGHPHIHVVTTNIQRTGARIALHNIGRNQSEKARKEIELDFKLVQAQRQQLKPVHELKAVQALKIQYGKSETKRAITNVLDAIIPAYKYTSLAELNAVLKLYNVLADRGGEGSRTYQRNGLVYRVLDEKGQKVGVPIKASAIYSNPGMRLLEKQYIKNESLRQPHKQRVRNSIDLALFNGKINSFSRLADALKKDGIHLVLRENAQHLVYGVTYIDHTTKCVFNGSDLGKTYSANALRQRFEGPVTIASEIKLAQTLKETNIDITVIGNKIGEAITAALQPDDHHESLNSDLRQEAHRKRKRKRHHL